MAKNNNLTDFLTDIADTIRRVEAPYVTPKFEDADIFKDNFPTISNNLPVYHGNWELGCYNFETGEYLKYGVLEPGGNWVCYNGNVWGNYSGFGVGPAHPNKYDFGGNLDVTHRPCICFKAPKQGRIKLSLTQVENTDGWFLLVCINNTYIFDHEMSSVTLDEINAKLGDLDVTVVVGDIIRFIAVRNGENWNCTMMPSIRYEKSIKINPQQFSDRIAGIPALVKANEDPGEVTTKNHAYTAKWYVVGGQVEDNPFYNDIPATVPAGMHVSVTAYGAPGLLIEAKCGEEYIQLRPNSSGPYNWHRETSQESSFVINYVGCNREWAGDGDITLLVSIYK